MAWMNEKYPESEPQFDDFPVHDSQMDQLLLLSSQQKMLEDLQNLNSDLESAKLEVERQGKFANSSSIVSVTKLGRR